MAAVVQTLQPADVMHVSEDVVSDPSGELTVEVLNLAEVYRQGLPELAPELIHGVLRQGHKLLIAAPSKAGKSFALVELAVAIAEGRSWLGFKCSQGRVLYLNLEIDPASFLSRIDKVYDELATDRKSTGNIDVINLRGRSPSISNLVPLIVEQNRKRNYAAVVLDPVYKIMAGGDENAAGEIGEFCNQLDRIASETGASVIYCHHFSKGAQGQKAAIDRASGSGVFGRDPDAIVTLSELKRTPDAERWLDKHYETVDPLWRDSRAKDGMYKAIRLEHIERVTAWRVEFVLREFATPSPVNVWFRYPVHVVDRDEILLNVPIVDNSAQGKQRDQFENDIETLEKTVLAIGNGEPVPAKKLIEVLGIGSPNTLKNRVKESTKLELEHLDGKQSSPLYVRPIRQGVSQPID